MLCRPYAGDMTVARIDEEALAEKLGAVLPHLDERQRRLTLAAEARALGHGGIAAVARVAGASRDTVRKGIRELQAGAPVSGRVRAAGAGRPRADAAQPGLAQELESLVEPVTRGDPQSPLRWVAKSLRELTGALARMGYAASTTVVRRLLKEAGYSLQGNAKTIEGAQHPDRDGQFAYINDTAAAFMADGQPVVSVDTKKKELVGAYKNPGREWQPKGEPVQVKMYDFPDPGMPKAVPYGVYDLADNSGWVSVGSSGDTAAFAVESIRRWWTRMGQDRYPAATRLLITADAGGSNSARARLWKLELARFAAETGLQVTVLHFPPGTSKWNRIEHRMFNFISLNWRGRPLTSYATIVDLIANTTTSTGLTLCAEHDPATYPTGVKVTDRQMKQTVTPVLTRHKFHGEWNYSIQPPS
jgi:Rhodopirellula transposase DDE domain